MSRIGKQIEHKTRQAEKLLQYLKQKQQKKKKPTTTKDPNPSIIINSPNPNHHHNPNWISNTNPHHQTKSSQILPPSLIGSSSPGSLHRATCDGGLGELYFQLFFQKPTDPCQAQKQILQCFTNMKKQLVERSQQLKFEKSINKNNAQRYDKAQRTQKQLNRQIEMQAIVIEQLTLSVQEHKLNYHQNMERINAEFEVEREKWREKDRDKGFNNSLNASLTYDIYQEKIKQLISKLQAKQQELAEAWNSSHTLQTQISTLTQNSKTQERVHSDTLLKLHKLEQSLSTLQLQFRQHDSQRANLKNQQTELADQYSRKQAEYEQQVKELKAKLVEEGTEWETEEKRFKGRIRELEAQLMGLREQQAAMQEQIRRLTQTGGKLQEKFKQTVQKDQEQGQNSERSEAMKLRVKELEQEKMKYEQKIAVLQKQLVSSSQKIASLEQQSQTLSTELHKSQQSLSSQKKQLDNLQSSHTTLEQSENSLKQAHNNLQLDLHSLQEAHKSLQQQSKLKEEQSKQLVSIMQQLTEELSIARNDLEELELKVDVMKQENRQLLDDRDRLVEKIRLLQQTDKERDREIQMLRSRDSQGCQDREKEKQIQKERENQRNNERAKEIEITAQLQKQLQILQQKQKSLQKQNQQGNCKIQQMHNQNDQLKAQISKLQKDIEKLAKQLQISNAEKSQQIQHEQPLQVSQNELLQPSPHEPNLPPILQLSTFSTSIVSTSVCEPPLPPHAHHSCPTSTQLSFLQQQKQQLSSQLEFLQQERVKENSKYVRTIESLTMELNEAYIKINEAREAKDDRDSQMEKEKEKERRDASKDKNIANKSVSKLKSYFNFGD